MSDDRWWGEFSTGCPSRMFVMSAVVVAGATLGMGTLTVKALIEDVMSIAIFVKN